MSRKEEECGWKRAKVAFGKRHLDRLRLQAAGCRLQAAGLRLQGERLVGSAPWAEGASRSQARPEEALRSQAP
jgi:hypothetical protein